MRQPILRFGAALPAAALLLVAAPAFAGPPYDTDDPEPTDVGHWEIYSFAAGEGAHGAIDGSAGLDLNYGAAEDVQLTATLPIDFSRDPSDSRVRAGAGDLELAVKYRFFHDEKTGVAVAIFPRVIFPTTSRPLGSGRANLLLPLWAQKDFGSWSLFGGGGYEFNPGSGNRNFWQSGLALTRAINKRLSIGGEITHQGPDSRDAGSVTGLGLGGIYTIGGPISLLVSAGPSFEAGHRNAFHAYAALGLNF